MVWFVLIFIPMQTEQHTMKRYACRLRSQHCAWVWVFFLIGDNYVYQSWYELNFWQSQFIICETYGCQSVSVYELMTQILWFRLLTELLRVSALTLRISGLLKPTVSVCWKWKWLISINIWIKIKNFPLCLSSVSDPMFAPCNRLKAPARNISPTANSGTTARSVANPRKSHRLHFLPYLPF